MQVERWAVLAVAVITWTLPAPGGDCDPTDSGVRTIAATGATRLPSSALRGPSGSMEKVTPAPPTPAPAGGDLRSVVTGSGSTTDVTGSDQLAQAIAAARPGDMIRMAAGTYSPVVISSSGAAEQPITLTGRADAAITGSGYTLHIDGASYWQLVGFGVSGCGKGVMLNNVQHTVLDSLDVGRSGDEAVHFRTNSSDNVIQRSTIHDTGLDQPQYGDGVYVGSAKSNWKKITGGQSDLSMNNRIVGNPFRRITAENVDVKEETSGTWISGNRFDGSATSGEIVADVAVDKKCG